MITQTKSISKQNKTMMISEVENNTDEITSVAIDIHTTIIPSEEDASEEHGRVCVCRVPKSLSSGKPEAFSPQLVGLGPYHHTRYLTMTDELKLAAAKRVIKHDFQICLSHIQPFYHHDAFISCNYNHHNLVRVVTLDALFLLALLHRSAHATHHQHSYFLTGKHGLPLVNALGVELTMDAIIGDVFMLENQIPTRVLHQVSTKDEIEPQNYNLGAKMKSFCEIHCPLVKLEQLVKNPEQHDHLLDLMYNLIVHEKYENIDEDNENKQYSCLDFFISGFNFFFQVYSCMMCGCTGCCLPESDDEDENEDDNENDEDEEGKSKRNRRRKTCCSKCYSLCALCFNIWRCFICLFSLFFCVFIWLWAFIRALPTLFIRALHSLYDLLKFMSRLIHPAVDRLYGSLSNRENQNQLRSLTLLVGGIKRASEELMGDSMSSDSRPLVMIPSVTEIHKGGIGFQRAEGGISSIKFDEGTSMFSLPVIKLDVKSEVIMRNLVAYESLIDSNRALVFSRYTELMKDIIHSAQDVKVLVNKKIIVTKLRDEAVVELFKGMNKSVRPTNCLDLEKVIKKVNGKFNESQKVKKALIKYVYSGGKFYAVVAALLFLALKAVQAYCSVYSCSSGTSKNVTMPPPNGDYDKNSYFVSSL